MKTLRRRVHRLEAARPKILIALLSGLGAAVLAAAAYFYMATSGPPSDPPVGSTQPAEPGHSPNPDALTQP